MAERKEYNIHDWESGEIVSEEKIDNIENGIYVNSLFINNMDKDIQKILKIIDNKPIYSEPVIGLTLTPNFIEKGSSAQITITPSFIKNDAGDIISVKIYKSSSLISNQANLNPVTTIVNGINTNFKIELEYNNGPIKNSTLGNPYQEGSIKGKTVTKTTLLESIGASYYGFSSFLEKTVKKSRSFDYKNITFQNDKVIYKYPKELGALTSIKDDNNFEYINSYNRTEETINGIIYYSYIMKDETTVTNFRQIFK